MFIITIINRKWKLAKETTVQNISKTWNLSLEYYPSMYIRNSTFYIVQKLPLIFQFKKLLPKQQRGQEDNLIRKNNKELCKKVREYKYELYWCIRCYLEIRLKIIVFIDNEAI